MDSYKHIYVNLSHLLKGEEKVIRNLLVPFDTRFGCVAEVLTTRAVPWKDLGNTFERFWCYSHLTAVELSLVIRQAGSARNGSETRFLKRVELTPKRRIIIRWKDMWIVEGV